MLLKYREEIIAAKVAKEHTEETLRSEIMFLKDQVVSEQQEKNTIEETLSQELSTLQEKLGEEKEGLTWPVHWAHVVKIILEIVLGRPIGGTHHTPCHVLKPYPRIPKKQT